MLPAIARGNQLLNVCCPCCAALQRTGCLGHSPSGPAPTRPQVSASSTAQRARLPALAGTPPLRQPTAAFVEPTAAQPASPPDTATPVERSGRRGRHSARPSRQQHSSSHSSHSRGSAPLLVAWVGMALSLVSRHFLAPTAKQLAHAVLALPRLLAPAYRPVGRQVLLRSVPAVLGCAQAQAEVSASSGSTSSAGGSGGSPPGAAGGGRQAARGQRSRQGGSIRSAAGGTGSGGGGGGPAAHPGGLEYLLTGNDPLLPLRVTGALSFHRMVTYRARLLDLFFLHHLQLQA